MKRFLYIDGNNFLHFWGKTSKLMKRGEFGKAQKRLIHFLFHQQRLRKYEIWIFFDSIAREDSPKPTGRLRILFSGNMTADKLIFEHLLAHFKRNQTSGSHEEIIVVSDDHEVRQSAFRFDFKPLKNEEFFKMLLQAESRSQNEDEDEKPEGDLSQTELDEWLELFEQDYDDE